MRSAAAEVSEQKLSEKISPATVPRPILILTINNGAAHTRAAQAIARAWRKIDEEIPTRIVEVSAFMSRKARFTHVTAYLWLVKNAPAVWGKIDAYQKRQPQTSPDWFYRRECRRLFEFVEQINPAAIVATEVGCGEIAALIKRDLQLTIPLVAVNLDYDADRAWIQPETDLFCLATFLITKEFRKFGAAAEKIKVWGAPLNPEFKRLSERQRQENREQICQWLKLDPNKPIALISGGGEGLGKIEAITNQLFHLPIQIVILTGRNKKLKERFEKFEDKERIRILDWTEKVPDLMQAADVLVSKLGLTFYEAMACGLPIVALEPPPGAERIQYNLLEHFGVGRAAKTVEELPEIVGELLEDENLLRGMRGKTEAIGSTQAAEKLAAWLHGKIQ